jgi:hypothetical protein
VHRRRLVLQLLPVKDAGLVEGVLVQQNHQSPTGAMGIRFRRGAESPAAFR